jgi:hypothetical protein
MLEWQSISESALVGRIAQGRARMSSAHRWLWDAVCIPPERWQQHPYGDAGGGFWVVGLMGRMAIWYNDIEEGFSRSVYSTYGLIDDYWRNDDELDVTIGYVANALAGGADLLQLVARPRRGPNR